MDPEQLDPPLTGGGGYIIAPKKALVWTRKGPQARVRGTGPTVRINLRPLSDPAPAFAFALPPPPPLYSQSSIRPASRFSPPGREHRQMGSAVICQPRLPPATPPPVSIAGSWPQSSLVVHPSTRPVPRRATSAGRHSRRSNSSGAGRLPRTVLSCQIGNGWPHDIPSPPPALIYLTRVSDLWNLCFSDFYFNNLSARKCKYSAFFPNGVGPPPSPSDALPEEPGGILRGAVPGHRPPAARELYI